MKKLFAPMCALYTLLCTLFLRQNALGSTDADLEDVAVGTKVKSSSFQPRYYMSSEMSSADIFLSSKVLPVLREVGSECRCKRVEEVVPTASHDLDFQYLKSICNSCSCSCNLPKVKGKTAPVPLILVWKKSVFTVGETISLNVQAVDILSKPVKLSGISLKSLTKKGISSNIFYGVFDESQSVDLTTVIKTPGQYTLTLEVAVEGKEVKVLTDTKVISVVQEITVGNVKAGITDEKVLELDRLEIVATQNDLIDMKMKGKASNFDVFHVVFETSPTGIKAEQRFLKLSHTSSEVHAIFQAESDGLHQHVAITLGTEAETFAYTNGTYVVSILIGDVRAVQAVEWVLGNIELSFPTRPVKIHSLYTKSLLHTSDTTLTALPEISHKMRPPAPRASAFMSTLFTGLALFPLVLFVVFIFSLKPNLNRLKSPSSFLFVGCIAGAILLYSGYWFGLPSFSFYQTIKYICFLAPTTIIIGSCALSSVVQEGNNDEEGIDNRKRLPNALAPKDATSEHEKAE